jgi:16S rRNA (uracil1498-N3)-methyltransferase
MDVPQVSEPIPFADAVQEGGVLLHNDPHLEPLEDVVGSPARLFIGPEGGWSEEEMQLAGEAGLVFAQLGPYRLRSETAGLVAVARTMAVLGLSRAVERS